MRRLFRLLLISLLATAPAAAQDQEDERPQLVIESRLGAGTDARLFNDEPIAFLAKTEADPAGRYHRGVVFTLLEPGGHPDRAETVVSRTRDGKFWGRPPSSFRLPLNTGPLAPGSYRLRADERGHRHAEIGLRIARIDPIDLEVTHERDRYAAAFRLRLNDPAEKRPSVPIRVRVEGAGGEQIDEMETGLFPGRRAGGFESPDPIVLSSRVTATGDPRPHPLRVVPGCSLVVLLDGFRFAWPVPLPPEKRARKPEDRLGR